MLLNSGSLFVFIEQGELRWWLSIVSELTYTCFGHSWVKAMERLTVLKELVVRLLLKKLYFRFENLTFDS